MNTVLHELMTKLLFILYQQYPQKCSTFPTIFYRSGIAVKFSVKLNSQMSIIDFYSYYFLNKNPVWVTSGLKNLITHNYLQYIYQTFDIIVISVISRERQTTHVLWLMRSIVLCCILRHSSQLLLCKTQTILFLIKTCCFLDVLKVVHFFLDVLYLI